MAILLDGKKASQNFLRVLFRGIPRGLSAPRLLVVAVGYPQDVQIFVCAKARVCRQLGVRFRLKKIHPTTSTPAVCKLIAAENAKFNPDGIVVQLPLPAQLDTARILKSIPAEKDIDGLVSSRFVSPVVLGINYLFAEYDIPVRGRRVVVVGQGRLVGKPVSAMLRKCGAKVVVCDQNTAQLGAKTKAADILVTGVGKPGLITAKMVKLHAVVVDVGCAVREGKIYGDVDFLSVAPKASAITPVPGGIGPMTVAMLLANLVSAWQKTRRGSKF